MRRPPSYFLDPQATLVQCLLMRVLVVSPHHLTSTVTQSTRLHGTGVPGEARAHACAHPDTTPHTPTASPCAHGLDTRPHSPTWHAVVPLRASGRGRTFRWNGVLTESGSRSPAFAADTDPSLSTSPCVSLTLLRRSSLAGQLHPGRAQRGSANGALAAGHAPSWKGRRRLRCRVQCSIFSQ